MRNKVDFGSAAFFNDKASEKPEFIHDNETLELIIASDYNILMQGSAFFEPLNFIYNSTDAIKSIGINILKNLLFITDETRAIYK